MSPKRILLVEDDPQAAGEIRQMLSQKGYEVEVASDGYEALAKTRQISPHLIILDAVLPKMNGFQVARLLKFDPKFKEVPILMLTVLSRPEDRQRGEKVGVDAYLTKPFTTEALLQAIQGLLQGPAGVE